MLTSHPFFKQFCKDRNFIPENIITTDNGIYYVSDGKEYFLSKEKLHLLIHHFQFNQDLLKQVYKEALYIHFKNERVYKVLAIGTNNDGSVISDTPQVVYQCLMTGEVYIQSIYKFLAVCPDLVEIKDCSPITHRFTLIGFDYSTMFDSGYPARITEKYNELLKRLNSLLSLEKDSSYQAVVENRNPDLLKSPTELAVEYRENLHRQILLLNGTKALFA